MHKTHLHHAVEDEICIRIHAVEALYVVPLVAGKKEIQQKPKARGRKLSSGEE